MLRLLLLSMAVTGQTAPEPEVAEIPPQAGATPRSESNHPSQAGWTRKTEAGTHPFLLSDVQGGFRAVQADGQSFRIDLRPQRESDLNLVAPDDALRAQLKLPGDRGLVVSSVAAQGPAWLAGVRDNDVLSTLDGTPLGRPEDLDKKLREAGEKPLTLELLRKGAPVKLTVQAQTRVALGPVNKEQTAYAIGVAVVPVGSVLRSQLALPDHQGLIVTTVEADGPAARAEIKVNDVVLSVDGRPQTSQEALGELVRKSEGKPLTIELIHEGERRSVKATPEKVKSSKFVAFAYVAERPITSVARPGVVLNLQNRIQDELGAIKLDRVDFNNVVGRPASGDRLDAMAAEVKELRKAVDELRKALERKK